MSNLLLVGANGFIGRAVADEIGKKHRLIKTSNEVRPGMILLDATNYNKVLELISKYKPEVIVNCAGVVQNNESAKANVTISMNLLAISLPLLFLKIPKSFKF